MGFKEVKVVREGVTSLSVEERALEILGSIKHPLEFSAALEAEVRARAWRVPASVLNSYSSTDRSSTRGQGIRGAGPGGSSCKTRSRTPAPSSGTTTIMTGSELTISIIEIIEYYHYRLLRFISNTELYE